MSTNNPAYQSGSGIVGSRLVWHLWLATAALIVAGCLLAWAVMLLPTERLHAYNQAHAASRHTSAPAFRYATPAPAAGPCLVWVNTGSKVYHYPGYRWYGRILAGKFTSEPDAMAEGDRPPKNERRPVGFYAVTGLR